MSVRRIDKAIALVLFAVAVLLAIVPVFFKSPPEGVRGSVASNGDEGRRALFLLVHELGFHPEVWAEPPGRLPRGEHLLWLARAPLSWSERAPAHGTPFGDEKADSKREQRVPDAPSSDRKESETSEPESAESEPPKPTEEIAQETDAPATTDASDTTPVALGAQLPAHYRSFVEEGGTLVLRHDTEARRFLVDDLGLDAFRDLARDTKSPAGARRIHLESGEALDANWRRAGVFRALASNGSMHVLWTGARSDGEDDEVLAVVVPVGSGRIVLLGDDAFLDNAHLRDKDHALLAARLAEHVRPGGRLLFDEFALGLWQPPTATGLATSPPIFLISAHLVLLACLFVWTKAWVRTFPRDPPALSRVSPLSRARSRAALCRRAGRYDLLADMLRRGSSARWLRIAGLRPAPAETNATEIAKATPGSIDADLARVGEKIGLPQRVQSWRDALLQRRVLNAASLDDLARDLDRISAEIETAQRRSIARAG